MRKLVLLLALAMMGLAGAAFALADTSSPLNPAQQCRAEQADANFATGHGGKTFAQFYGTNGNQQNAFGKCVSTKAQAQSTNTSTTSTSSSTSTSTSTSTTTTTTASSTAAALCRAERTTDPAAFKAKYGTNTNKSNAFGKCVSAKAKAHSSS
jgi:hypothetical protein